MVIEVVSQDAEQRLLSLVEQESSGAGAGGVLQFQASKLAFQPTQDDVLLTVRPTLSDKHGGLYFFRNGDFVVTWKGLQRSSLEELCARLYERYAPNAPEKLHSYFDLYAQGEELRLLCKQYIAVDHTAAALMPAAEPSTAASSQSLQITERQTLQFRRAKTTRASRPHPEILVVEDQAFSARLLLNMLGRTYRVNHAANAGEALELYSLHAPDIAFLDIELPDMNGHALAQALRILDPQAHLVMVTANNYAPDVLRAKENQVKGFIVKPYNKQKIDEAIAKFRKGRS